MIDEDFWLKESNSLKEIGMDLSTKVSFNEGTISPSNSMANLNDINQNSYGFSGKNLSENPAVKKWMEEHDEKIAKMDAEQIEKETEMRRIAKEELEKWRKSREETIEEKKKAAKKTVEQVTEVGTDEIWSSSLKFMEANAKASKCTKDTSRIKSSIIKMKEKLAEKS